jgi:ankyrin repeat protein
MALADLPDDAAEGLLRCLTAVEGLSMCKVSSSMTVLSTQVALREFRRHFGPVVPAYLLQRRAELFKLVERASHPEMITSKQRREVFAWAAAFGFEAYVKRALQRHGTSLLESKNACPLRAAVLNRRGPMVRVLLEARARVDRAGASNETLLAFAIRNGEAEMAELLLEADASPLPPPAPGGKDETPLSLAIASGNVALVRALCQRTQPEEAISSQARAALLRAVDTNDGELVKEIAGARIGLVPTPGDSEETPPLLSAAASGAHGIVEVLLAHLPHEEVHFALPSGKTALYLASEKGHAKVASLLLEARASLEVSTCSGRSPLFAAVEHNHPRAVRVLASAADVRHLLAQTHGGATPVSAAEKRGVTSLLLPLLECYHRQVRKRAALRQFGDATDDVSNGYLTGLCTKYQAFLFAEARAPQADASKAPSNARPRSASRGRVTSVVPSGGDSARYTRVMDGPRPRSACPTARNSLRQTLDLPPKPLPVWRPGGKTKRPVLRG